MTTRKMLIEDYLMMMQRLSMAIGGLLVICSTGVAEKLSDETLQEIAGFDYGGIDFSVQRDKFSKEFRGALKVDDPDAEHGVTLYAIRDADNKFDVVCFFFLDGQLMQFTFTYQEERIVQLGGLDVLIEKARKRFGTPTKIQHNSLIWAFPSIDRQAMVVWHDNSWVLGIQRPSVLKQLEEAKLDQIVPENPPPGLHVTREQYGANWPLTVEDGFVESIDNAVVFHTRDGKSYALNGIAMGRDYLDIEPIWRPHPVHEGMRVSIGPLIEAGRSTRTGKSSKVQYSKGNSSQQHRRTPKSLSRNEMAAKIAEKTLKKLARELLPAARRAARLSAKDNAAAERYLDSEIRPHVRHDPTLTDSSFAVDGLCQVCFDYSGTNLAGQICVTARIDGYEDVSVDIWPK